VPKITSLTTAPKPRLNFLSATVGHLANGEGLARTAIGFCNHNAFVDLNPLFIAFFNPDVNFNSVARSVLRETAANVGSFDFCI
jgi:hypothetical protein